MKSELFYDHGLILYVPDTEGLPTSPEWALHMAIAVGCEKIHSFSDLNVFVGADEQIIAIQMPSPGTDRGVPVETVLSALRDVLSEDEITELIDIICSVQDSPELAAQH